MTAVCRRAAAHRGSAAIALVLAGLLAPAERQAEACAACGCGDQTLTATGTEKPYQNRVRIALEERAGESTSGDVMTGDFERTWTLRSALALSWAPHDRVTIGALLPWVAHWVSGQTGPMKRPSGLGDLELSTRVVLYRERRFAPRHLLWGMAGLKTPTGPRAFDDTGHPYSDDIQPGSGSWDPFFGATYGWFGDKVAVFASASYRLTTPNTRGYRRGSQLGATVAAQYQPVSWFAAGLGLDLGWLQADTLATGAQVPSTGGVLLDLAPSLMFMPTMDLLIRVSADIPMTPSGFVVMNGTQSRSQMAIVSLAYDIK
jgi:hypothetical protein